MFSAFFLGFNSESSFPYAAMRLPSYSEYSASSSSKAVDAGFLQGFYRLLEMSPFYGVFPKWQTLLKQPES